MLSNVSPINFPKLKVGIQIESLRDAIVKETYPLILKQELEP
jgi:hypothetical protein